MSLRYTIEELQKKREAAGLGVLSMGVCPRCALRQVMPGTKVCGVCSERWITYKGNLRARYKLDGLCVWCGGQRDRTDRVLCAGCRQKRSERHRRAVALRQAS